MSRALVENSATLISEMIREDILKPLIRLTYGESAFDNLPAISLGNSGQQKSKEK